MAVETGLPLRGRPARSSHANGNRKAGSGLRRLASLGGVRGKPAGTVGCRLRRPGEINLPLSNTTVSLAQAVAAGKFVPPRGGGAAQAGGATSLPAFCRVALTIEPSADSDIKSEVWLPMSGWNGKFLQVGNGAWGGSIQYGPLGDGLRRGYAAASTDTGHTGDGCQLRDGSSREARRLRLPLR